MKILQLDLTAYGPFTNATLDWSGGAPGLHIVYGANEAGKTSALRALSAFLFGIPLRTDDDFIHDKRKLQIGAVLRLDNGETHALRRVKKNKDSLRRVDDDQSVEPQWLRQILGGVDREAFAALFGIDHAELTAGGQAVLKGEGDMGKMLFSAAAGMPQVLQVQAALNDEAKALFAPRAKKSNVNQLLRDYKAQRDIVKAAQTSSKSWQAMSDAVKKLETQRKQLSQKIAERETDLEDLHRIIQAEQDLHEWPRVQAELKTLENTPRLPEHFGKQRKEIERILVEQRQAKRESERGLKSLRGELLSSTPDENILALADRINELKNQAGAVAKAAEDRPGLEHECSRLTAEMAAIAEDIGPAKPSMADGQNAGATALHAAIEELSQKHGALVAAVEKSRRRIIEAEAQVEQNRRRLQNMPAARNAEPLKQAIRKAQTAGDLEASLAAIGAETAKRQRAAKRSLKKLHPWKGDLHDLEQLPRPNPETVERLAQACEQAEGERTSVERDQQQNAKTIAQKQADLESLRNCGDVPTEADLAAARSRRDEGWRIISQGVDRLAEELAAFLDAAAPENSHDAEAALFAEYERCVRRADDTADRLRHEAQQVAEKTQALAELARCAQREEQLRGQLEAARQKLQEKQNAWKTFWEEIGTPVLPPKEMHAWLEQCEIGLRNIADFRDKQQEQERLQEQCDEQRRQLLAALSDPCSEKTRGGRNEVLELCEAAVREIERETEERRKIERDSKREQAEAVKEKEEAREAQAGLAQWREAWERLMPQINLKPGATPAMASAVMRCFDEYESKSKAAAALRARMADIDRDMAQFAQDVAEVCDAAANIPADLSPHQALDLLAKRSGVAQERAAIHKTLQAQREEQQQRLAKAENEIEKSRALLDALRRSAKCGPEDDLEKIEEQSRRVRGLEEKCQQMTRRLESAARGAALEVFAAREQQRDFKQARTEEKALESEIALWRKSLKELDQNIGAARTELNRIDASDEAARADEAAERILAKLRRETRRYLRAKVASLVLDEAIARHRKKNEKGPVVARAETLFRQLSGGSFSGLNTNDAGSELIGRRSVGADALAREDIGKEQMSTGARDQLYLALRLASLEHRLQSGPKLPFIVDDILIQFDDARAVAALQVLAELSQHTQVILFTHHKHLVRLALENLPADVLFTQELGAPVDSRPLADGSQKELFAG